MADVMIQSESADRVLACVDGKCRERNRNAVTQEQIDACAGKGKADECTSFPDYPEPDTPLEKCKKGCRDKYKGNPTALQACIKACEGEPPTPPEGLVMACVAGAVEGRKVCRQVKREGVTQAQIDACEGKTLGADCDAEIPIEPPEDGDCPQGDWYTTINEKAVTGPGDCIQGYAYIQKGNIKRCECVDWCVKKHGCDENCQNCGGGGGGGEQWTPSGDLQAIIQSLLARINELLGYDTGLSEEELQAIINRMTGNIKAGERGRIESMEDRMAGMGLLGTGMELEEYGKIGRQTREVTADVEAQVAIDQALRKYEEFMGTTGMAQSLFGTVLGTEQLEEILNAARRGEGRQDMGMMLQYLSMILGKDAQNPYWQAILNQMTNSGDSGGGGNDWMYWLPFLLS